MTETYLSPGYFLPRAIQMLYPEGYVVIVNCSCEPFEVYNTATII